MSSKKAKILIGFDNAYISKDSPSTSKGRYALYIAETLAKHGHTIHLHAGGYVAWDYNTYVEHPIVGLSGYDRFISFADPMFTDYPEGFEDDLKNKSPSQLFLITHYEKILDVSRNIDWGTIITWNKSDNEKLEKTWDTKIVTWYPPIKQLVATKKDIILGLVRYGRDAEITYEIMKELYSIYNLPCFVIHAMFFSQDHDGIKMFITIQNSGFINVLAKLPYPSFLHMLNRAKFYVEPTPNQPIWNPAEALMHDVVPIRFTGYDEYIPKGYPASISATNYDKIDYDEINKVITGIDNVYASNEHISLVTKIREEFNYNAQQELLLNILGL